MTIPTKESRDKFYTAFFLIHIPVTILIDSCLVLPPHMRWPIQEAILNYHIAQNKDFLLIHSPLWLSAAGAIELVFQLPFFFVGAYSLLYSAYQYYPLIFAYGVNAALTTLFCLVEIAAYNNQHADVVGFFVESADKWKLASVYLPTFIIPFAMCIDFYQRMSARLVVSTEK